jgi:uncharacterized membrane protein
MNAKTKGLLILIIPIVVIALIMLIPAIPTQIPAQVGVDGKPIWYIPKWAFTITGIIPFLIWLKYGGKK